MKKLFENWKKYLNESAVADAAGELEAALRQQDKEEAEKEEEQKKKDAEQDAELKNSLRKATEQQIQSNQG